MRFSANGYFRRSGERGTFPGNKRITFDPARQVRTGLFERTLTMKLIHTADLHLDAECSSNYSADQAKIRRNELLKTFLRIIQYAEENAVGAVLISGDLFDRKTVSKTAANAVYQAVIRHPEITFFYLRGNHDAKGFLELFSGIPDNLKLFSETWTTYPLGETGRIRVTGRELTGDRTDLYDTLALTPDAVNIVMLHAEVSETAKPGPESVNLRGFRNRFIDYLALGHYHAFRKEELDSRGAYVYPGCPEGRGFDESGEKGFVLLDIDEEERIVDSYFVPFALHVLHLIPVSVDGITNTLDVIGRVRNVLDGMKISDGDSAEVILEGSYDAEDELNTPLIEETLKDRFTVFKVKDKTRVRVDYDRYALDLSLKGEFIRTVRAKDDLSEDEKAMIIRAGLAALRGEVDRE